MSWRRSLPLLVACFALSVRPVHAADTLEDAALKREADRALLEGVADKALPIYERLYETTHDPALLYNQARALTMLARHPDALDKLEQFDRDAGADLRARVPMLPDLLRDARRRVAILHVTCNVEGATARVNGGITRVLPLNALRMNPGAAEIAVEHEGYFSATRSLTLPGGAMSTVEVRLVPRRTRALLTLRSAVTGTAVFVDEAPVGNAPAELDVSPGRHKVRATANGFEPFDTEIALEAGDERALDLRLSAQKSIVTTWWFWTGVGVVLAGGAATIYAVSKERDGAAGDIAPGRVFTWRLGM